MNTSTPFLIMGVAILVAAALSLTTARKIIQIRRTPTSPIGALPAEGRVEVAGQTGNATTRSPISSTNCVLWQAEVQEEHTTGSGKNKHTSWSTVYKETSTNCFDVIDETGRVRIDPSSADLILNDDLKQSSGWFQSLDSGTLMALEGLGISTTNFLGLRKTLKVHERYISPNEKIYVLGDIQSGDSSTMIAKAKPGSSLIISDRSEKEVLSTLYGRLAMWILIPLAVGVGMIFFLSQTH